MSILGLKTIVKGEEWHKDCYERANPAKGPYGGLAVQLDRCPGCHQEMIVGQETGTSVTFNETLRSTLQGINRLK